MERTFWFTLNGHTVPMKMNMSNLSSDHIPVGEVFIVPAISISGGLERFGGRVLFSFVPGVVYFVDLYCEVVAC